MKEKTPDCPRCRTNVNVVEFPGKFRCVYCETIIFKKGQLELTGFLNQ